SWSVLRLQVIAIIGERSSQALPTPVARLVAPGPSVAMQRPGAPVMRPLTSAANPAEPSCAVSTNSTPPRRMASISGSTFPLGIPNPRRIPASRRVATIKSALFMERGLASRATGTALLPAIGKEPGGGRRRGRGGGGDQALVHAPLTSPASILKLVAIPATSHHLSAETGRPPSPLKAHEPFGRLARLSSERAYG